jgi:hypothetical protein
MTLPLAVLDRHKNVVGSNRAKEFQPPPFMINTSPIAIETETDNKTSVPIHHC